MSSRCDICGVEALENQEFTQERVPFRRARRYCPACHKTFYHRVYLIMALVPIVLGAAGMVEVSRGNKRFLDATGIWTACLCAIQWAMILPHELGHAMLARWLGYQQIRILVGSGRPLFSARFLGFAWLFNLIPAGGLTIFHPGTKPDRWKRVVVVAAGPFVNLSVAVLALPFIKFRELYDGTVTWTELVFWANLIVLGENLFPYVFDTPFGRTGTDGFQLWYLLFRWKKPIANEPGRVPLWELILCYGLKCLILLITSATCLLLGFLAVIILIGRLGTPGLTARILVGVFVSLVSFVVGWITVRVAVNPIAKTRKPSNPRYPGSSKRKKWPAWDWNSPRGR